MFLQPSPTTLAGSAVRTASLTYHTTVRYIRKSHGNAVVALLLNVLQAVIFVAGFWGFYAILGIRQAPLRGDFMLFIMSGIFLYMTHTKTVSAVSGSEGPTSAMMKHAPMTTAVTIASSALSTLYLQVLTMLTVLAFYHVAFNRITIAEPIGALGMMLVAWVTGLGIGMVLLGLKPWAPHAVGIVSSIYTRVSMIASGKMFVANALPTAMLAMFDWNPLFHAIDQTRGFLFVNYNPYYTSPVYPLKVAGVLIVIGMMLEFRTRKSASISWGARN